MFGTVEYPITVVELDSYIKEIQEFLPEDEQLKIIDHLAFNPEEGEFLPHYGGIRRFLWQAIEGENVQVYYYFRDLNMPLYLLAVYAADEDVRCSDFQRLLMVSLVERLVQQYSRRWHEIVSAQK